MATLKKILGERTAGGGIEQNIEKGYIYAYSPGTEHANFCNGVCWTAPSDGKAIVEIWGAGGSGSRMCCCGDGLPGNAGGYAKKTLAITADDTITASLGMACMAHPLCHSGCGSPTQLCYVTAGGNGNGCMCARGGFGGKSMCTTGTSFYCCYSNEGFCFKRCNNDNCALICNVCSGAWEALAYGGDVNCCGEIGCVSYFGCCPHCKCFFQRHAPVPAGMFAENGALITFQTESDTTPMSQWSGNQLFQYYASLNLATKAPRQGNPRSYCWRSDRSCGCYESQGCANLLPVGAGGLGPLACPDVRDHGIRGGHGGVRIKFIAS